MNISISSVLAMVVFGIIGTYFLKYARAHGNFTFLFIALAMFIYPYFIDGPVLTWGVGLGLCGLAYLKRG